jgi:diketogulonate reductase-like aldo/keto reductase
MTYANWNIADVLLQGFIPLPKSVTPSRIEENADVYDFELTSEEMKTLDTGVYGECPCMYHICDMH